MPKVIIAAEPGFAPVSRICPLNHYAIQLSTVLNAKCRDKLITCVQLFQTPWTVACQALLSMGFLQARILEWVSMPSSRGFSQLRDQTQIETCFAARLFTD